MNTHLLNRFVKEAMLSPNPQLAQTATQFNDQLMRGQQEEQVADADLMKTENPEFQVKNPIEDIDQMLHSAMPEIVEDEDVVNADNQNKTAAAYVKDRPLKEVLKVDDIERFAKGAKDVLVVQYGMVVKELISKADPHNLAVARAHIKKEWDGRRLSSLKDEVYEQAKEKFVLILNDRIIDGHHFLAKAEKAGLTSSVNVIDLTPVRFQTKKAEAAPTTVWGSLVKQYGHSHNSWENPFEKRSATRVPGVRVRQRAR